MKSFKTFLIVENARDRANEILAGEVLEKSEALGQGLRGIPRRADWYKFHKRKAKEHEDEMNKHPPGSEEHEIHEICKEVHENEAQNELERVRKIKSGELKEGFKKSRNPLKVHPIYTWRIMKDRYKEKESVKSPGISSSTQDWYKYHFKMMKKHKNAMDKITDKDSDDYKVHEQLHDEHEEYTKAYKQLIDSARKK